MIVLAALLLPAAGAQGFDPASLDRSVSPCQDFYQYACGTWLKRNPIPPDQSRWGRFDELNQRNLETLRQILEKDATVAPKRPADEQKTGDYYAACMDAAEINRRGIAPIQAELDRIAGLKDKAAITDEVIRLHRTGVGAVFEFGSGQDFKNSNEVIAQADQGGLGLPDRDYYLKTDPKSVKLREQYRTHVEKMFGLLGEAPARAKQNADTVLAIETGLAKGSLDNVSRRDPDKVYHKMTRQELISLNPGFNWTRYFDGIGAPPFERLNVAVPNFFRRFEELIVFDNLDQWKAYLTWHLLHSSAKLLPDAFVNENFNFYGKILTGAKELRPRWKRCVSYVDGQLGDALGKQYVERTFGAEGKQRTLALVEAIEKAMGADIQQSTWMTAETKKQALLKLHAVTNKIGYPDKWRDYSSVKITRDDAFGNAARADAFEFQREVNKISKPVDRSEWEMSPPTVNAYYQPTLNSINFPAGILQPPFFDKGSDEAANLGAIGSVIGHELTHGFDDEGSKFDAQGNLRDWWTPEDEKNFHEREQCFVKEYAGFVVDGDVHLNGELTLGENTADNGGVRLALAALLDLPAAKRQDRVGGLDPQQRLFVSFAQIWCENETPEAERLGAQTDPHSEPRYRVKGVLQNMPEFEKAFGCHAGQPMVSAHRCRAW